VRQAGVLISNPVFPITSPASLSSDSLDDVIISSIFSGWNAWSSAKDISQSQFGSKLSGASAGCSVPSEIT
jgi:hypothetical protein